jgi:hypothetical protein
VEQEKLLRRMQSGQVLVAHAYNPSYWGGSDHEDCGLKPEPGK